MSTLPDSALLERVKTVYAERPRLVDLAAVLAIIMQESSGVAIFRETDNLFQANLAAALKTGVKESELRAALVIQQGPLKGHYMKFRYEPSYMPWIDKLAPNIPLARKVLFASSVGVGQQMLRFVLQSHPVDTFQQRTQNFAGDTAEQIRWVIGNLEGNWLKARQLLFAKYNLGGAKEGGNTYKGYGKKVLDRSMEIQHWLDQRKGD